MNSDVEAFEQEFNGVAPAGLWAAGGGAVQMPRAGTPLSLKGAGQGGGWALQARAGCPALMECSGSHGMALLRE